MPVALTANTTYRIGALAMANGEPVPYTGTFSLGAGVSSASALGVWNCSPIPTGSGCTLGGPMLYPARDDQYVRVFANAEVEVAQTVPEPTSRLLLGAGLASLIASRRRS